MIDDVQVSVKGIDFDVWFFMMFCGNEDCYFIELWVNYYVIIIFFLELKDCGWFDCVDDLRVYFVNWIVLLYMWQFLFNIVWIVLVQLLLFQISDMVVYFQEGLLLVFDDFF